MRRQERVTFRLSTPLRQAAEREAGGARKLSAFVREAVQHELQRRGIIGGGRDARPAA